MDLNTLKLGPAVEIKDKVFLTTAQYITPFLDSIKNIKQEHVIQVKELDCKVSGAPTSYLRVSIEALLPQPTPEGYTEVIGCNYSLDIKTPVIKYYRAFKDDLNNLIVPNENLLSVQEIIPGEQLQCPVEFLMKQPSGLDVFLKQVNKQEKIATLTPKIGEWIRNAYLAEFSNSKQTLRVSADLVATAYKLTMLEQSSPYYNSGATYTLLDIYQAMASQITVSKDVNNKFEKTAILKQILNVK